MTTILVTGGNGFLGSKLATHLRTDSSWVMGLGHSAPSNPTTSNGDFDYWADGNICLETLTVLPATPSVIIHCAGSGSVARSVADPGGDFERTVVSMVAILEYCRRFAPEAALVLPSSASVYGVKPSGPISESSELRPVSPYGVHKLTCEQLCRVYAATYGLKIAVIRFFSLYGLGLKKQILWDASNKLMRGEAKFFGTGLETRDFLHVNDAVKLVEVAAATASSECPILNGGTGIGVTVKELLENLALKLGSSSEISFGGESRAGDPSHYCADVRLANHLGWHPEVSLEVGLAEYIGWFRGLSLSPL